MNDTALKHAAVLAPVIQTEKGPAFLLIKRARHPQDPHSGQLAFPGGRSEPEDQSATDTALRETYEEIGVAADKIQVLTPLPAITTGTGYVIEPILATMQWPLALRLQQSEVADTLVFPIAWLSQSQNIEKRLDTRWGEVLWYRPFMGEVLWGASARIVQQALASGLIETSPN